MKTTKVFGFLATVALSFLMVFPAGASVNQKEKKQKKGEATTIFRVEMDCQSCVNTIEKNIPWEKGVTDMKCDIQTQTVEVTYKTSKTNDSTLVAAFKKIGKDAAVITEAEKNESKGGCCSGHDHGHSH